MTNEQFKTNLERIEERIAAGCRRTGRNRDDIRLMAVTKSFPVSDVEIALSCGVKLFGENRVQEAAFKYRGLLQRCELHLVGHLQRNKAQKAAEFFSCIQSIDKHETAEVLNGHLKKLGTKIDILIEVNTSEEKTKFGVTKTDDYFRLVDRVLALEYLDLRGLMTVGPMTSEEKKIRTAFSSLKSLQEKTLGRYPDLDMRVLSMGMSSDYEIAVEEGATLLRIGTALFGERR
ncbi:MAG: YggS family pyridoxal phosphate-dependent enzyme [Spirochaetales bacterium]|nr:YggS family pyridoxal phosphate-dependent enzyme [Spirochaetales bacterium]